jgi:ATP-dependent helicase/nuclease subunit B
MVLRALLMRHETRLKLFGRSARRPGFAQELSALLNEFQQQQLAPAKLRALAAENDLRRELRDKLHDLALLHETYRDWLAEHALQDANRLLDFATDALRNEFKVKNSKLKIEHLWLDGFAEMTPQELDLLADVMPFCTNATLAFCLDEPDAAENSWLSIWNVIGKTFQRCRQRIEHLPDAKIEIEILKQDSTKNRFSRSSTLQALETCWQSSAGAPRPKSGADETSALHSICLTVCANPEAEATFAAREILKFVRKENRFRDCAVLVRNLDHYHKPVARVFRRYGIPFFLDRRESVAHHPLAELTRSALRTIAFDWQHNDWFAALKAGFAPVNETEIDRLENAALEFGWRGKKWREPLPDDSLENIRERILPPFENFSAQLAKSSFKPDGPQLANALRELWDELRVENTLEKWSSPEPDNMPSATHHPSMHSTVFEQMNTWLDNLELAFPREPLSLRDWLQILEAGLASLTVGVIPPVLDEVLIGSVDRARNPDLKLVLVLGVNESVFPAAPAPSAILTDADRDELGGTVSLGPDVHERLARERFYGYIACTRASEQLVVTFSRNDPDGRALNPSPFIAHLQRLFPKLEVEAFQSEIETAEAEHANELIPTIVQLLEIYSSERKPSSGKLEIDQSRLTSAATVELAELLKLPAIKPLAEHLRQLREPNPEEKLSPTLAERLFGPVLKTSVSRLEEFAQCPFKFFVRSGLHAGERKLFELDARERGNFQHEVLKMFHKQLAAEGKRWRDLTPQQARECIGKIASGLVENFHEGLMRDTAQTRFEARAMTESLQDFVAVLVGWMRGQYEFDPVVAELDFGGQNSNAPAWVMDLGSGHKLALQGRIDRVDLWRDPDGGALAVVMDYKSGGKKLDSVLVEHGVQLQLPAYLSALRHWKNPPNTFNVEKLIPAGGFYVNLRGQFEGGKTRNEVLADSDETQRKAYRHTGRFDAGALDKLDRLKIKDQFSYQLKKDGGLYANSTEALPRAEFEALLDGVEVRLREMGSAIFSGETKVDPYRKGTETPCTFCDYASACRIDPWTHQWRVLLAAKDNPA